MPQLRLFGQEYKGIKRYINFISRIVNFQKQLEMWDGILMMKRKKMHRWGNYKNNDRRFELKLQAIKSRLFTFNITKVRASRKLFWAYFVKKLVLSTLIINVDEPTFWRTSKINYLWSKKGRWAELKNAPYYGSTSMILAVLSNGCWNCLLTPQKINSDTL